MLRHLSAVGAAVVGLVGLASTPLVNAAACTTTSVSNSAGLNTLLSGAWNGCTGVGVVTLAAGTYLLTAPYQMTEGAKLTFDGTGATGPVIIKPASTKAFVTSPGSALTVATTLTLKGLTIEGNGYNNDDGGQIYFNGGVFYADRVTFKDGDSDGTGGCVFLKDTIEGVINNCLFTNCKGKWTGGGALAAEIKNFLNVTNTVFSNNWNRYKAGAVMLEDNTYDAAAFYFQNVTFQGNANQADYGYDGGAVYYAAYVTGTTLTFQSCKFLSNYAAGTGGGIHFDRDNSDLFIYDTVFLNNTMGTPAVANDIWSEEDPFEGECLRSCPAVTVPEGMCPCPPAPTSAPTPAGCFPSPNAFATTTPSGKVAPLKTFSYSATLVNSHKSTVRELQGASSQGMGSVKSPYFGATFTLPLPAGVTFLSAVSSPKTTNNVSVANNVVTWNLGNVKPGGKLKVALKLVAAQCTTPAPLTLFGQFAYTDAVGPKTASACLRKGLYVWADSCPAIPKATKPPKPSNSSTGTKKGESWNQCNCNTCKCNGKTCACPQAACTCTPIP